MSLTFISISVFTNFVSGFVSGFVSAFVSGRAFLTVPKYALLRFTLKYTPFRFMWSLRLRKTAGKRLGH